MKTMFATRKVYDFPLQSYQKDYNMKAGTKLRVMRNGDISQCYIPWGEICEFVKSYENYICVRFRGEEMLINKELLVEIDE